MLNKYMDSTLTQDIDKKVSTIENIKDSDLLYKVMEFIPFWIVHSCKHYTDDFLFLEKNWINLCQQWNTTPKNILIVEYLPREEGFTNYKILEIICNRLTKYGYVIRNQTELVPCELCKNAQITEQVYSHLKHLHVSGKKWNTICNLCKNRKKC